MFDDSELPSPPDGDEGWEQGDVVVPLGRAQSVRRLAVAVGGLGALVGLDVDADDRSGGGIAGEESAGDGGDPMAWVWSPAVGTPDAHTLGDLAEVDTSLLTEPELVAFVARVEQAKAWVEGLQVTGLAALAGAQEQAGVVPLPGKGSLVVADVLREEVAGALGVGHEAAQGRIDAARVLTSVLPGTLIALKAGRISGMKARVMAEAVRTGARSLMLDGSPVDPDSELGRDAVALLAAGLESRALPRAEGSSVGAFRATVTKVLAALDPAGAAERARRARKTRDVVVRHEGEGQSTLIATLGTDHALAIQAALEAAISDLTCHDQADGHGATGTDHVHDDACPPGCDRGPCQACAALPAGEARAEALTALVLAGRAPLAEDAGRRDARPAGEINLVIDLPTLLGLDDRPAQTWEGIGVPADVARELAGDATLRRLVTDPQTGALLDYGTTTYAVPEPLARFVKARDRVCGFPLCTRRATRCGPGSTGRGIDLDHEIPYGTAEGAGTDRDNLGPLCRRHHLLKTHLDWQITRAGKRRDGATRWRSPQGRRYETRSEPLVEPLTADPDPPPF